MPNENSTQTLDEKVNTEERARNNFAWHKNPEGGVRGLLFSAEKVKELAEKKHKKNYWKIGALVGAGITAIIAGVLYFTPPTIERDIQYVETRENLPRVYTGNLIEETDRRNIKTKIERDLQDLCIESSWRHGNGAEVKIDPVDRNINRIWCKTYECTSFDEKKGICLSYSGIDEWIRYNDILEVSGYVREGTPILELTLKEGKTEVSEWAKNAVLRFIVEYQAASAKFVFEDTIRRVNNYLIPFAFFDYNAYKTKFSIPFFFENIDEYTLYEDESKKGFRLVVKMNDGKEEILPLLTTENSNLARVLEEERDRDLIEIERYTKKPLIKWKATKKRYVMEGFNHYSVEVAEELVFELVDLFKTELFLREKESAGLEKKMKAAFARYHYSEGETGESTFHTIKFITENTLSEENLDKVIRLLELYDKTESLKYLIYSAQTILNSDTTEKNGYCQDYTTKTNERLENFNFYLNLFFDKKVSEYILKNNPPNHFFILIKDIVLKSRDLGKIYDLIDFFELYKAEVQGNEEEKRMYLTEITECIGKFSSALGRYGILCPKNIYDDYIKLLRYMMSKGRFGCKKDNITPAQVLFSIDDVVSFINQRGPCAHPSKITFQDIDSEIEYSLKVVTKCLNCYGNPQSQARRGLNEKAIVIKGFVEQK